MYQTWVFYSKSNDEAIKNCFLQIKAFSQVLIPHVWFTTFHPPFPRKDQQGRTSTENYNLYLLFDILHTIEINFCFSDNHYFFLKRILQRTN